MARPRGGRAHRGRGGIVNDRRPAELVLFGRIAELEGAPNPRALARQVLDEFTGQPVTAESADRVVERIRELAKAEPRGLEFEAKLDPHNTEHAASLAELAATHPHPLPFAVRVAHIKAGLAAEAAEASALTAPASGSEPLGNDRQWSAAFQQVTDLMNQESQVSKPPGEVF